jgi:general secretion pathway protein J
MTAARFRARGFTLIELMVALLLMAGIASILYGSLALASQSWDRGEAKAEQASDMRAALTYLRTQLSEQYPQRIWKTPEVPLMFAGEHEELRYAAVLPERVAGGGVYYFRLAVVRTEEKSQLVQERTIPDPASLQAPEFADAERSVLADNIAELRLGYFGRDPNSADAVAPTWRDRWEDPQRLPLLVRLDVKPVKGAPWPTLVVEPRRSPEAGCVGWDQAGGRCSRGGR